MTEPELPVVLTYQYLSQAQRLLESLEDAKEQVIWESRAQENGDTEVRILNIINLEEKAEEE